MKRIVTTMWAAMWVACSGQLPVAMTNCVPITCEGAQAQCGLVGDGCGEVLDCGGCATGQACGLGGQANTCTQACSPLTCAALSATCGQQGDGCGGVLDCGTCATGQTCGGGGPNTCGEGTCIPTTCAALGATCGAAGNGCGQVLDCGSCSAGQLCGVAGPNRCGTIDAGAAGGGAGGGTAGGASAGGTAGGASAGGTAGGASAGGTAGGAVVPTDAGTGTPLEPTRPIGNPSTTARNPAIAWSGTQYLAVWEETGSIFGARVRPDATLIDQVSFPIMTGIPTMRTGSGQTVGASAPAVVWDGANFVVAVFAPATTSPATVARVLAVRVSPAGVVLDQTPIRVSQAGTGGAAPRIASNGTNTLISWNGWAARLSRAGVVLDTSSIAFTSSPDGSALAIDGTDYLVVFSSAFGTLLEGRRIASDGTLPAASFTIGDYNVTRTFYQAGGLCRAATGTGYGGLLEPNRFTRLTQAGAFAGAGVTLPNTPSTCVGTNTGYLVTYPTGSLSAPVLIAQRFTATGALDGAAFQIDTDARGPAVAGSGTSSVVVYTSGTGGIRMAAISNTGTVSPPEVVSRVNESQGRSVSAFDGTNSLVVWTALSPGNSNIHAARVAANGTVIDANPIVISSAPEDEQVSSIAFNGTDYLVVWTKGGNTASTTSINAARVSTSGVVRDPGGLLVAMPQPCTAPAGLQCSGTPAQFVGGPRVASNGVDFFVTWQQTFWLYRMSGNLLTRAETLRGAQVSGAGVVGSAQTLVAGSNSLWAYTGLIAPLGTGYLLAWQRLDWLSGGGTTSSVRARRLTAAGAAIGAEIVVSNLPTSPLLYELGSGGGQALLVWGDAREERGAGQLDLYGARVDASGALLDPAGLPLVTGIPYVAQSVMAGGPPASPQFLQAKSIVWTGTAFAMAWETPDMDARLTRIAPNGAVLNTTPIALTQPPTRNSFLSATTPGQGLVSYLRREGPVNRLHFTIQSGL